MAKAAAAVTRLSPLSNIPYFIHSNPPSYVRNLRRSFVSCLSWNTANGDRLFAAARLMVDKFVMSGMVLSLGSGQLSGFAIQYLGTRLKQHALSDITGIPLSTHSAALADAAGIPLISYKGDTQIDFAFDDADMVEEGTLAAIIGRQDAEKECSLMQQKCFAKSAKKVAFLVTGNCYTKGIYGAVPVLVNRTDWMQTAEEIDDLFLGDAEVWRRPAFGNAGPSGGDFPLITKEGHHILDIVFTSPISELGQVAESLEKISGVVEYGIISSKPYHFFVFRNNIFSQEFLFSAASLLSKPVILSYGSFWSCPADALR